MKALASYANANELLRINNQQLSMELEQYMRAYEELQAQADRNCQN